MWSEAFFFPEVSIYDISVYPDQKVIISDRVTEQRKENRNFLSKYKKLAILTEILRGLSLPPI